MEDFGSTSCYVVGGASGAGRGRALLVVHDVFGVKSGRTRLICDELASSLDVLVVAPVLWQRVGGCCGGETSAAAVFAATTNPRKKSWGTWLREKAAAAWHFPAFARDVKCHTWDVVGSRLQDEVLPALRERGVERLGALGFCWGAWVVFHACSLPDFCCGVSVHPSQVRVCEKLGEDFKQLSDSVRCPQLLLSAGDDHAFTKEGGLAEELFKAKPFGKDCFFKTFPDMKHGWSNRGDLEDEAVARDVAETWTLVRDFLKKQLG